MDHLQKQLPAQAHNAEDDIAKDVHSPNPRSSPSDLSLRTLYGEQEVSTLSVEDVEKVVKTAVLTGKYAKYAGEPPDGGLKAWTVVLG